MNFYERLIENPLFFKWIYHPSEEINAYWEHYLEANPAHAPQIEEIKKQFEEHLRYREKKLTDTEKRALAKRIILQLEKAERQKSGVWLYEILCVMQQWHFCFFS